MKTQYITTLLLALVAFVFSACNTTEARRAGRITTAGAVIGFDAPQDQAVFEAARIKIDRFLATGKPVTDALVDEFVVWLVGELDGNPAAVNIVVAELRGLIGQKGGFEDQEETPARAFLAGVSDVLAVAYP